MQSKTLLERTHCPESTFKVWLRKGVIVPAQLGQGAGHYAIYDEANAVALIIGIKMKHASVTVSDYAPAFIALQNWLRNTSALKWSHHTAIMTPYTANIHPAKKNLDIAELAFVVPLAAVCATLSANTKTPEYYQHSLLGLHSVQKSP